MKLVKSIIAFVLVGFLSACINPGTPANAGNPTKRWITVVAVKESPLVNQVIRESGNNPAIYTMQLRTMIVNGTAEPATGRYCFIPYDNGRPSDSEECFTTTTGIYSMWAPASFIAPGKAMCVKVPGQWPAIAGQVRYPSYGGKSVNCRDFGDEATGLFAATKRTSAMIPVVKPFN